MRKIFRASKGLWSWADLHQAEMRIWANQAHDEVMLEAFRQGSSPHVTTFNYLFPGEKKTLPDGSSNHKYVDAKSFNFALLADASIETLARTTQRPVEIVKKLHDEMYELYWQSVVHQNEMRGRHVTDYFYPDYVESDFGRRCHTPDSITTTYEHAVKCRLNYPFQSTVADIIKRIMLGLDALGMDFPIQVHDEIVADGNWPESSWPRWMSEIHPSVPMPFEVDQGVSWV